MDIQAQLGSDIAMVLDECLAHPADAEARRLSAADVRPTRDASLLH